MGVVVGVDCSTQSTKVELRDVSSGALVASGRSAHPPTQPPRSEQDPQAWWSALRDAMAQACSNAVVGRSVVGMAIAGQQHGLVALDERSRVLRPAKLRNDTESAADAKWLLGKLGGPDRWAQACGSVPTAAFTITKLSWLHRNEPENFSALARVLLPHDWLTAMCAGVVVTDRGDASGTGYWSPSTSDWRTDLLDLVSPDKPWKDMLPRVLGPAEAAGVADRSFTRSLGLPDDLVVAAGTGDNMATALGVGAQPGDIVVSIGTSGTVFSVSETPTADPTGAVAGFADATGRYLPLVCTNNAARVTDAFARILGIPTETMAETALASDPGAGGLVVVPYLDGERTPDRPEATGWVGGMRTDITRAQVARAAYEGVVNSLLDGFDALRAACPSAGQSGRTLLVGGGARSSAYRRVLADLSGRPVLIPPTGESVATGACVQAAAVVGGADPADVAESWDTGLAMTVDPDESVDRAAIRAAYATARDRVAP